MSTNFVKVIFCILLLCAPALAQKNPNPGKGKKAPLTITTTTMPDGIVGVPYSFQFTATGGTPPYHWSVTSGSLPPGLTLASNGSVTGTPLVAGNYSGSYGRIRIRPRRKKNNA